MKKLKRCLPVIVLAGFAISASPPNAQDAVTGNQLDETLKGTARTAISR